MDKLKKHKKRRKHKHKQKDISPVEKVSPQSDKNERYTPELSPKSTPAVCKNKVNNIINGKSLSGMSKNAETTNTEPTVVSKPETEPVVQKADSLEVISSESEDGVAEAECDSDAIDVNVIEADMDLEELMKQKELLQAEIAKADMETSIPTEKLPKAAPAVVDEVILVDDSSNDEGTPATKKQKRSISRERRIVIERKESRNAREDLRRKRPEPVRDQVKPKDRGYREPLKYSSESRDKDHNRRNFNNRRSLERSSMDQSRSRIRDREIYERQRARDKRYDSNRNQHHRMDHHHHRSSAKDSRRHKERSKTNRVDKQDKFKDSLSEGMKHGGSSDSEIDVNIDLNEDEEDEQKIIERRRKQREELLKVCHFDAVYIFFYKSFLICCVFLVNY